VNKKYYFFIPIITIFVILITYYLLVPNKGNSLNPQNFIKVMDFNIGGFPIIHSPSIEEVVKIIQLENPDIVFLQDVGSIQKLKKISSLSKLNYYLPQVVKKKSVSVAILARFPLLFKKKLILKNRKKITQVIFGEISFKNRKLLLISTELSNILLKVDRNGKLITNKARLLGIVLRETFLENYRSKEAEQLLHEIKKFKADYIIMAGDFHSLPFSLAIRKIRANFKDCSWLNKSFFQSSIKTKFLFFPIKVDYIFVSNNLECSGTKILQESPNDHFPIVTNIAF